MGLLLKRALDQAAVWHRAQKRKYPNADVPYMSHLAGVAVTLARHGFDDEVVAAGALHDVIEDQGVTREELAGRFGARVAGLVWHVTEHDKSQPWEERKRRYLAAFPGKPWEAQAISLADKIDNFRSIAVCAADHGDPWAMFKRGKDVQMARFEELLSMCRALAAHPLIDEYGAALDAIRDI
ncbi:MAG: bifunctional (p)ppGpp synthetase/guanosine-3',5'-bis(diphosphate) 3'-pyrophosphohydrolase [Polyangiaceae bacterium]|nr:bifunctional (p)ppGpp synthetase/guanosine-3',5'-bis(diphosphate) 3'-pyrophosphohydrolase [Polyangiaceae bacterium]